MSPSCIGTTRNVPSSVQLLSHAEHFVTPWPAARQASLSIANSWSLLKLTSIESVTPSSHLILCCPLLLPPSIFPSIRVFSKESALRIRWPKYWSFSFSICPSKHAAGKASPPPSASAQLPLWPPVCRRGSPMLTELACPSLVSFPSECYTF